MGSKKRDQKRAAALQIKQTEREAELAAEAAALQSQRERILLGELGQAAGREYERGLSDFQKANTSAFNAGSDFMSSNIDRSEFDAETSGTPQAVTRLQQLIREQALPEQQRALAQGKIALQQQGVRGPESALMMQRQQNQMGTDLAQRAEQVALQQALSDRKARQGFSRDRALAEQTAFQKQAGDQRSQLLAQARADRQAQQKFARDRAISAQEKSYGRNIKAN
tara:strand:- start:111 stop:785 length:675 start_codon:yes stop_codon:yes gene_type:complete